MKTLDEARTAYPHLGMALYALDPGGPVTLETLTPEGDIFTFHGASEADVIEQAFPTAEEPEPEATVDDIFG